MSLWDNDLIQFARLLDEIRGMFIDLDYPALCESMDLDEDDIDELFERAMKVWERAKAEHQFRTIGIFHDPIPADYEVQPLAVIDIDNAIAPATCGHCLLTWDDGIVTSMTPTPSARCPFESFHRHPEES